MPAANRVHQTLIVGAGFTGLGTAIKLRQAGVEDIVIVERGDSVGGTWRDNTYPGVACDIPSLLYSFSFVKNPSWSRAYPSGTEICEHIEAMTDQHGLRPLIRFNTEVTGLSFDEKTGVWTVKTNGRKRFRARTVVLAAGPLADHKFPEIRGIDSYEGHKIHSASWDHDYDFTGKRVAVIGTGATAVQIIPELVKTAEFVPLPEDPAKGVREMIEGLRNNPGSERIAVLRKTLQEEMDANAQVFRTEETLTNVMGTIHDLRERFKNVHVDDKGKRFNTDLLEAVELGFLLDIAEVVVVAAKNRKESRGGHMRDDYPNRDDENYMQHTMSYLSGDAGSSNAEDHIRLGWKPVVFTKNEKGELNYPPMERKY